MQYLVNLLHVGLLARVADFWAFLYIFITITYKGTSFIPFSAMLRTQIFTGYMDEYRHQLYMQRVMCFWAELPVHLWP